MPAAERAFFEPRFGADFSAVRLHRDEGAAQSAASLDARAFTLGKDVVMGARAPETGTPEGRELLAHELTHVVQQGHADAARPQVQRNGDDDLTESAWARERRERRRKGYKQGIDHEAARRKRHQEGVERRKQLREERLWASRMKGDVDGEIKDAAEEATDTVVLEEFLGQIADEYGLKDIRLEGLGTEQAKVVYQINPTYEVMLGSTGERIALRMRGQDTSSKFSTNFVLRPSTLTLPKVPPTTTPNAPLATVVGSEMEAKPLSQDAEQGSEAGQDKEQSPMMAQLRGAGNTSLPNPEKYIKGHLLNDNLGGPAIPANLFPITAEANAKHLAWVEKFVKSDVAAGYVMAYGVQVKPVPSSITPVYVASPTPQPGYQVDATFHCESYRLDQTGDVIPASKAEIDIPSVYGNKLKGTFDVKSYASYQGRYDKINEGKGTPTAKSVYANEAKFNYPGYDQSQQNQGKISGLSYSTVTSFSPPAPSFFFGAPVVSAPGVTVDEAQVPASKLSLQTTAEAVLIDTWEKVAKGWSKTDVTNWIKALRSAKPRRWEAVKQAALADNLPKTVADELFDGAKALGRDVMKLG